MNNKICIFGESRVFEDTRIYEVLDFLDRQADVSSANIVLKSLDIVKYRK